MFVLKIKTGGDAYHDPYGAEEYDIWAMKDEIRRNLKQVYEDICDRDSGFIMDYNGNKVGEWRLEK